MSASLALSLCMNVYASNMLAQTSTVQQSSIASLIRSAVLHSLCLSLTLLYPTCALKETFVPSHCKLLSRSTIWSTRPCRRGRPCHSSTPAAASRPSHRYECLLSPASFYNFGLASRLAWGEDVYVMQTLLLCYYSYALRPGHRRGRRLVLLLLSL